MFDFLLMCIVQRCVQRGLGRGGNERYTCVQGGLGRVGDKKCVQPNKLTYLI